MQVHIDVIQTQYMLMFLQQVRLTDTLLYLLNNRFRVGLPKIFDSPSMRIFTSLSDTVTSFAMFLNT